MHLIPCRSSLLEKSTRVFHLLRKIMTMVVKLACGKHIKPVKEHRNIFNGKCPRGIDMICELL